MIVVTNAGGNVNERAAEQYGIEICPQGVVVAGKTLDTRERVPFHEVDAWVRSSSQHPHVLGTTAREFVTVFQRVAAKDHEIIVVQGSKKLVQSYQAAASAAKTLHDHPRFRDVGIHVVDSKSTDIGVGLIAVLVAAAGAAGVPFAEAKRLADAAPAHLTQIATVRTFDYLIRGGRASVFKARLAELMRIRPMIGWVDGEVVPVGRMSSKADRAEKLAEHLRQTVGEGRAVWAAVAHGGDAPEAERLLTKLRADLDVEWGFVTPLAVTTYLNSGPGALNAAVLCVDRLPWRPEPPKLHGQTDAGTLP
ncbi:MAG: DegV family EDD domain-containing protein [Myxococcales bacterium]|nr:DegV family EDD domain-containing protein [Myxococcales bacterium]